VRQVALPLDGHDNGPLFAPVVKRRPARVRTSGGAERWAKYRRARSPWATWKECGAFWDLSAATTAATGVQHSVDHIVPLAHPLVCGLHCPANLRVLPLVENLAKGNQHWPDMWGEQMKI
jgi:5-methylcytosine-specific restriction endonuclease McrA